MKIARHATLSLVVSMALVFGGSATVAFAEPVAPAPSPSAPPATEAAVPPEAPAPTETPVPTEAPAPTEAPVDPGATPPTTQAPAPTRAPTPTTAAPDPEAQALATLPEPITNLPGLFIQLPEGYTVEELNASKDEIPTDPDVEPHAIATLVDPTNEANNLVDVTLEEIKSRGNFTWRLEKKPYQIKFDSTTSMLGMPAAKTWILLANHADPSLLRNKVAYDLAAELGLAASPDSRFVDLTINGEYLGNYLLSEKVEVKSNRLELQDPGGILLEMDNNYGLEEDFHFTTTTSNSLFVLKDAVEDVDEPLPQPLAESYADIQRLLNELDSYLYEPDPDWSKISAIIDVESFIKYYFVFELAENPEITQSSVYFWRDGIGGKLHAGPVWDFDSAFASYTAESLGGDPVQDYVKNAQFLRNKGNGWFAQLFRNEEFVAQVNQVFQDQLEAKVNAVVAKIDGYAADLPQSAAANFSRWNVLGQPSVFPGGHVTADTWEGEVSYLRDWVETRAAHLASAHSSGMPVFKYDAHVASIGWQPDRTSGQIVGTSGRALQVEALDIALLQNTLAGTFQSRAHIQRVGWTGWQSGDTRLGTTGRALQLEAVQFRLTNQLAVNYDVSYRVHVQSIGWMDWVENGATAGTSGRGLQIEAIQIRLLDNRDPVIGTSVRYSAHVSNIGWMPEVSGGEVSGTTGRALPMEALQSEVVSTEYDGGLEYRAHVQSIGWMDWKDSSEYIGTVGRGLRMEALQIKLTGELADHYSIRYSSHVQGIGWQDWVVDGQTTGTTGLAKRVEALKIELVPKAP